MLSLRMIIFAGIGGIALWGLFSLLDDLKEPALLKTTKGVMVKGCGTLDAHKEAPRRCPALLCQKALVDRKLATLEDTIEMTSDTTNGHARIIEGRLIEKTQEFACVVRGVTVSKVELVSPTA